jgi:flotillin
MFISFVVSVALIAAAAVYVVIMFISRFLLICHPNEVIILSGRPRTLADGSTVGYRIIRGGRAMRIPILEKAANMSLETIPLELSVQNAYSKGGIPLRVEAIANVKIDSTEPTFGNALERFLGKAPEQVHEIAKDTLEGNLRGVLATLTPEEVNEDRLKFAQSLIDEADTDLKQLGLQLDTFKIQNISDEAGYLNSVGRRKTAEVIATARKAEAEKKAEAEEAEALSKQKAEVAKARAEQTIKTAQIEADRDIKVKKAVAEAESLEAEALSRKRAEVAKAQADQEIQVAQVEAEREVKVSKAVAGQKTEEANNNLRVRVAELEKVAVVKEQEALVASDKARAKYEQELEQERIILQQKRLTADVIEPARAKKEALELEAKGAASPIIETGQAKLQVLREMISTYQSAEGEGEKIFMLNMLPEIISQIVHTVGAIKIDKVSVIDAGATDGRSSGVARAAAQLPTAVLSMMEQIETATGVNILSQFQRQGHITGATTTQTPDGHGSKKAAGKPAASGA